MFGDVSLFCACGLDLRVRFVRACVMGLGKGLGFSSVATFNDVS